MKKPQRNDDSPLAGLFWLHLQTRAFVSNIFLLRNFINPLVNESPHLRDIRCVSSSILPIAHSAVPPFAVLTRMVQRHLPSSSRVL